MDLKLLAEEHAKDPDFEKIVSVPRGRIERQEIKVAILTADGQVGYNAVVAEIPEFATDPDFARIDVLHEFSVRVFDKLVTDGKLSAQARAVIASLGTEQVPRWKALGFGEKPQDGDIARALAENPQ